MSRIVLGNQRHQVGLTSDYPNMSAIEALVDQRVNATLDSRAIREVLYHEEITQEVVTSISQDFFTADVETPSRVRITVVAAHWEVVPVDDGHNPHGAGQGELYLDATFNRPFAVQQVVNDGGPALAIPLYASLVLDGLTPGENTFTLSLT